MFRGNVSLWIEPKVLADLFGGCSARIYRLDKKIGSHRVSDFHKRIQNPPSPYLSPKSTNPFPTTSKRIIKHFSFNPRRHLSLKNTSSPMLIKTPTCLQILMHQ